MLNLRGFFFNKAIFTCMCALEFYHSNNFIKNTHCIHQFFMKWFFGIFSYQLKWQSQLVLIGEPSFTHKLFLQHCCCFFASLFHHTVIWSLWILHPLRNSPFHLHCTFDMYGISKLQLNNESFLYKNYIHFSWTKTEITSDPDLKDIV